MFARISEVGFRIQQIWVTGRNDRQRASQDAGHSPTPGIYPRLLASGHGFWHGLWIILSTERIRKSLEEGLTRGGNPPITRPRISKLSGSS